jgi:hypothetical protein
MPLQHTMGQARPPRLVRVALWHARMVPASRRSHPPRPHDGPARVAWKSGPRQPEHQKPGGKGLWGQVAARLLVRREAQGLRPRAQRDTSTFSSPLSERRERSERSEFGDGPQARASQGSRRVQRPTAAVKRCGLPPQAFAAPSQWRRAHQSAV